MATDPKRVETEPADPELQEESSVESPEADTAEQRAAVLNRPEEPAGGPDIEQGVELPEADAVEQSVEVETDAGEEEYRQ
ncbi:hypothetical protein [Marinactinospora rubrisoli]|uniref:Uncharacterized protein n=1 Tax=Marinactinospora rubrisoli TaxID=2715399 RepID=A0ABW2KC81_9ACTN